MSTPSASSSDKIKSSGTKTKNVLKTGIKNNTEDISIIDVSVNGAQTERILTPPEISVRK